MAGWSLQVLSSADPAIKLDHPRGGAHRTHQERARPAASSGAAMLARDRHGGTDASDRRTTAI